MDSLKQLQMELEAKKGGKFADIFCHCYFQWALAWIMWQDFKNLYTDNERIKLLNDCGSAFFKLVHDSFHDSIILTLTRLTDRCGSMEYENATLKTIGNEIDPDKKNSKLQDLINELDSKTEFARTIRNKQISHNDLKTIIGKIEEPDPATIDNIDQALNSAYRVFKYIARVAVKEENLPKPGFDGKDALFTLNMLYRGNEAFRTELSEAEPTIPPHWVMKDLNK